MDCWEQFKLKHTPPEGEKRIKYKANGYAARPGSGPSGETCKTCDHAVRCHHGNKHYWKCTLMRQKWTGSYGTDIRLKSPSCMHWNAIDKNEDKDV